MADIHSVDLNGPLDFGSDFGQWRVDRYRTESFSAQSGTLSVGISSNQGAANRGPHQNSGFYGLQGYARDVTDSTWMSVGIYIDPDWSVTPVLTGLWATAFNDADAIDSYPTIGFETNTLRTDTTWGVESAFFFRSSSGSIAQIEGVVPQAGQWYNLSIMISGNQFLYEVSQNGEVLASAVASRNESTHMKTMTINSVNFFGQDGYADTAGDYNIAYRNLAYGNPGTPVPEPSTYAALFAFIVAGVALWRRPRL